MIADPGTLAALIAFGAVAAVDETALGQFMLARPIVAATVAGWIVGAPEQGALLGLLLETLHLTVLPVGAARYPEGGAPAVAAAGVYGAGHHGFAPLLAMLLLALLWEWLGGRSVGALRQLNARSAPPPGTLAVEPSTIRRIHLTAIALDLLRGALFTAVGIVLFSALVQQPWVLPQERVARLAVGAATVAGLAAGSRLFGGRLRLVLAGAAAGVLFLVLGR